MQEARVFEKGVKAMTEQVRKLPITESGSPQAKGFTKDIPTLMAEIRERIKADVESHRDKRPNFSLSSLRVAKGKGRDGDLQHSEELRFLNQNYAFETKFSPAVIPTHRRGLVGKLLPKFKRAVRGFFKKLVLNDYLAAQRQFNENLVRYLNDIGRYVDDRDVEVIRKIDHDVGRVTEWVGRIDDEKTCSIFSLEQQLTSITQDFHSRLGTIDSMVRGLEGILNNLSRYTDSNPPRVSENGDTPVRPDTSYLLLENRYRGGEGEIERRLSIYPGMFKGAPGTVLEIGSGRGELQRLFKKAGVKSYGVDLDTVMVNVANANGCDTKYGDGIAHLRSLPDKSLGGLIAIQVVEHLTQSQLKELCELAKTKLIPGAKVIFETINPQSMLALSSNYFRDPTHVWPMHPDTLGYIATLSGLKLVETKYLSPVSPNHLLKEIPIDSSHTPAVADAVRRVNVNLQQLNRLLYGHQDYCLVLEVA